MNLTLEIIRSYGFPEKSYNSDHDDICIDFETSNGLTLQSMIICNNEPVESDSLEGLDGYIYITTKEELDQLLSLTYEEVLDEIASDHDDFDKEDYL